MKRSVHIRQAILAAAAVVLAAAVFSKRPVVAAEGGGFVSSTPEFEGGPDSALDRQKELLLEAVDELYDLGFSPMAITEQLTGRDDTASGQAESAENTGMHATPADMSGETATDSAGAGTEDATQSFADSFSSAAKDVGDDVISEAKDAGNEAIGGVKEEAQRQAQSFLDGLKESLQEAVGNFIDSVFGRL